ncbi:unnamed protein product, partial [Polarella glacialis]
ACDVFLATRQGSIWACNVECKTQSHVCSRELGRKAFALSWSTGRGTSRGQLACALAGGVVEVLDASDLAILRVVALGSCDAIGVSFGRDGVLWALFADRSLARWADRDEASPDWSIPAPITGLRHAQPVPGSTMSRVLTSSTSRLQLWTVTSEGIRLDAQSEPNTGSLSTRPLGTRSREITVLACSSWIVACGYSNGE